MSDKIVKIDKNWKLFYKKNCDTKSENFNPKRVGEFSRLSVIPAVVPASFEYNLYKNGVIEDSFYSDNTYSMRKWESYHQWYFNVFDSEKSVADIVFKGIDSVADIFVNGVFIANTKNMFLERKFTLSNLKKEGNEIVIHIYPCTIAARNAYIPAMSYALSFDYPSLAVRRAPCYFGWDIYPRTVSGGIYREILLLEHKKDKIEDFYLYSAAANENVARINLYYNLRVSDDDLFNYSVEVSGKCRDKSFFRKYTIWHTTETFSLLHENPYLWMPKGYGEQNLYDVEVILRKNDEIVDIRQIKFGIRTVKLQRTSLGNEDDSKFELHVNGKKIFIIGTNWVPVDATNTNERERTLKAIRCADDMGCNAIRVWGGGVIPLEELYDYCDRRGILIWQDFMMACGIYPETDEFTSAIKNETREIIKLLRNRTCVALWAGDNEGDLCHGWNGIDRNANNYKITREIVADVVRQEDLLRPYLPSSPFIDERASTHSKKDLSENHLWGPRDYFKSDYYKKTSAKFASEAGYGAMPSPQSLKKFLKNPEKFFEKDGSLTKEYRVHSSNPGNDEKDPFYYRMLLITAQVKTLFGDNVKEIDEFCKASQISSAEAMKYFVETFRINRNTRGGIMWWNLLDAWPQVSEATIDYYFNKKISYHYLKRSQTPICFMCDEKDGELLLYLINDTENQITVSYSVRNVYSSETLCNGNATCQAYYSQFVQSIKIPPKDKSFYLISWEYDGKEYSNSFHSNIIDIDLNKYLTAMEKCGYDEWEAF